MQNLNVISYVFIYVVFLPNIIFSERNKIL